MVWILSGIMCVHVCVCLHTFYLLTGVHRRRGHQPHSPMSKCFINPNRWHVTTVHHSAVSRKGFHLAGEIPSWLPADTLVQSTLSRSHHFYLPPEKLQVSVEAVQTDWVRLGLGWRRRPYLVFIQAWWVCMLTKLVIFVCGLPSCLRLYKWWWQHRSASADKLLRCLRLDCCQMLTFPQMFLEIAFKGFLLLLTKLGIMSVKDPSVTSHFCTCRRPKQVQYLNI